MQDWERELHAAAGHDPDSQELRDAIVDAAMMTDLVHMLRGFRERAKMSQDDVAQRMGTTQSRVSNFERLGSDPRMSTVFRYARAVDSHLRWTCPVPTVTVRVSNVKPTVTHPGVKDEWTRVPA